jgi:hypothetical protein
LTELKITSRTQQRLNFQLDDRHPVGASHHQKLIVVRAGACLALYAAA